MKNKRKNNSDAELALSCELCGKPTGLKMKLGDLPKKIPDLLDRKQRAYRHGMCAVCKKDLEDGCVIFVDAKERCMKVNAKATREKISKEYWGKIVKVPKSAMDELIKVWLRDQPKSANGE